MPYNPLPILLCLLSVTLLACTPESSSETPPPPPLTFTVDYSKIPRATLVPLTPAPTVTPGGNTTVSFARDILPLLQQNCLGCHGGIANIWFTDYDHTILPSMNGPTIYPGEPERSPLYFYVRDGLMPANSDPLPRDQQALLRQWILEGAHNN